MGWVEFLQMAFLDYLVGKVVINPRSCTEICFGFPDLFSSLSSFISEVIDFTGAMVVHTFCLCYLLRAGRLRLLFCLDLD